MLDGSDDMEMDSDAENDEVEQGAGDDWGRTESLIAHTQALSHGTVGR